MMQRRKSSPSPMLLGPLVFACNVMLALLHLLPRCELRFGFPSIANNNYLWIVLLQFHRDQPLVMALPNDGDLSLLFGR